VIEITLYSKDGVLVGFKSKGHAGERGSSIVCAGVSTAVFGTYYFIKYATNAKHNFKINKSTVSLKLNQPNHDAQVALKMFKQQLDLIYSTDEGENQINIFWKEVI